jgi:hypothetical protein
MYNRGSNQIQSLNNIFSDNPESQPAKANQLSKIKSFTQYFDKKRGTEEPTKKRDPSERDS